MYLFFFLTRSWVHRFKIFEHLIHFKHFVNHLIWVEKNLWNSSDLIPNFTHQALFENVGMISDFYQDFFLVIGIEYTKIYFCLRQVRRHYNMGHTDKSRTIDIAAFLLKDRSKTPLHQFTNLQLSFIIHLCLVPI